MLAAGKGAGSLTEVAEQHYLGTHAGGPARRHRGHPPRLWAADPAHSPWSKPAIRSRTRPGSPAPNARWRSPTPRARDDLVLVLLSGGASANWIAPAAGITLAEKQATTRALLRSGANIGEINCVRKHLSRIKGGRLARRAYPADSSRWRSPTCPATTPR